MRSTDHHAQRHVRAALLDAVNGGTGPLSPDVADLAIDQGVASLLLASPAGVDLGDSERAALGAAARRATFAHLRALHASVVASDTLEAAGIPLLVVNGPVLQASWGAPARHYLDLDLVVPAASFGTALDALQDAGAEVLDRNWSLLRRQGRARVHLRLGGQPVDLHWHLVSDAGLRDQVRIPMTELFAATRAVEVDGVVVPGPSPVHALLHVALHAAVCGGHRLVWLADIGAMAGRTQDWDDVVRTARRWQVGLPVAAMLERARRTVGAPVPVEAIRSLTAGRGQRALVRALSRWQPSGRLPGGGSTGRGVACALRPTLSTTAAATMRESRALVARLLDSHPGCTDPDDDRRHTRFPAGELADYQHAVATTDTLGHPLAPGDRTIELSHP